VIWALAYEAYVHTALVPEARTRAASIIQAALDEARREGGLEALKIAEYSGMVGRLAKITWESLSLTAERRNERSSISNGL
jgi:hypothetical protein